MRGRLQLTVCKSQQGNSQVKSSGENQGPQVNKTVSFRGTPEPPQNTAALLKPQRPCGTPELSSQGKASAEPGWRLAEASPQEERRLPRGRADNISNRENTGLCPLPHGRPGHWGHPPLAKGGTWSGHRGVTLGNTVCPARYTSVRGPTTGESSPPSGLTSAWGNPGFRNRNPTTAQPHTASNLLSAHSFITQPAERGNLTVSRLPPRPVPKCSTLTTASLHLLEIHCFFLSDVFHSYQTTWILNGLALFFHEPCPVKNAYYIIAESLHGDPINNFEKRQIYPS